MVQRDFAKCLAVAVLALGACAPKEVPIVEVQGECGDAFKGQVCTWAHTKGDSLVDAGATVPIASIEAATDGTMPAWPPVAERKLKLPADVVAKGGLTQLSIFWEGVGHPPAQFMTPHFDFHFYVVPAGEEMTYDCKDRTKPATLPAGYVLPDQALPPDMAKMIGVDTLFGVCVPNMGMHSLPASEMERKDTFQGDMVIGYYAGKPIFIEPMLTKAMLMEKKSFDLPIPTIPGLTTAYPRVFHAEFDEKGQTYRFTFSGFAPGA
jgi:hypothetical protein